MTILPAQGVPEKKKKLKITRVIQQLRISQPAHKNVIRYMCKIILNYTYKLIFSAPHLIHFWICPLISDEITVYIME